MRGAIPLLPNTPSWRGALPLHFTRYHVQAIKVPR